MGTVICLRNAREGRSNGASVRVCARPCSGAAVPGSRWGIRLAGERQGSRKREGSGDDEESRETGRGCEAGLSLADWRLWRGEKNERVKTQLPRCVSATGEALGWRVDPPDLRVRPEVARWQTTHEHTRIRRTDTLTYPTLDFRNTPPMAFRSRQLHTPRQTTFRRFFGALIYLTFHISSQLHN